MIYGLTFFGGVVVGTFITLIVVGLCIESGASN